MRDIIGHGGGKGGVEQHVHYEATDSLHSISYARVLDLISEGEILGLANGMASVFLDGTPVQNADGSQNFSDITVDFRVGTQTQDYIPGFPDIENEVAVGVELRSTAAWTHAISNLSLSAIRITLGVPSLTKSDTTNGDVGGYQIDYQIELSKDGGAFAVVLTNSFNGKTTGEYRRSARIDLPPATTGWTIRVTRLTANANTASIADTTTIVSYTDVIDAKLRYPMSAIVGIQVDAKHFQSVPVRAYDMYGRIVQVPTNYDPVARTYTGVWDGTFKPAWTSCPPWIFRDMVLNDRYGLGARITDAQVDKWALYAIAKYCDEMVPNGKGGTEPRFACNVYLQSQKQAYAVLQDLASVFRGISYWGGGSVIASADMPIDPVYVYTAANVIGGKFSRVGSSKKTRYTVALVSWNDMTDFGKAKVEYVEDAEGIKRYGIQQVSMTAFGCSSQGQAQRVGRWALATSRFETGAISFDVGLDGVIALPGQIVRISDPARMGARNGGRIHSAAGRVVTLDKAPVINAGDSLTVILPSGVSQTLAVASVSGDSVTVGADWTTIPLPQSVWSVDSSALSAPTYKILSVKENKSQDAITYTVTATQHEPGKYAFVDSNTVIVPLGETTLNVTTQAAPVAVTVSGNTTTFNDVQKLALSVICAEVAGAVAYEGAYKRDSGNWIPLGRQSTPTFDVPDVIAGTYTAKLSAVNSVGVASLETVSTPTILTKSINAIYNAAASLSNAQVFAYQRASTAPTGTPGAVTYDFTAGVITTATLANGWQKTIPTANGNPLYVTVASASGAGSTDTIASTEWAGAVILAQDGPGGTGTNGLNTATATIFQRGMSATAPALPTVAATYNFGSATPLTGLNNGWSATVPVSSGGPYLFVSTATASSISGSDSIAATEWAAVQLLAQDGANGINGTNIARVFAYQRSASAPAGSPGTVDYDFVSSTITTATLANGWQKTIPTTNGNPLYVAVATASSGGTTDNIASGEWSGAVILSQDGQAGASPALLAISTTGQAITYNGSGVATPSGQSITITANLQNVSGTATFVCTKYNAAGTSLGSVTLGGSGNVRTLTDTLFTTSASYAIITATLGALSDTVTIVRLADGAGGTSALAGYLTNEAVTVPTAADGSGAVLTGVTGSFKVFQGTTDVTSGCTFAIVGSPVVTTAAPTSGTGAYSVTAVGTWGNASLTTSVTYRATHTASGATIDQQLTITKAPAGVTGPAGLNNATVQIYQRASSATAPSLPSATTTYTFATGVLAGLNNGWTTYVPTAGGAYLHTSLATAAATTATDTIAAGEWAAATILMGAISLGSDGTLSGSGGGQVTLNGMGLKNWRAVAVGASSTTHPVTAGLYLNGTLVQSANRSYMLTIISRATGLSVYSNFYDVYGVGASASGRDATALANDLNTISSSYIAVVWTFDEPLLNHTYAPLLTAMYRCGASRPVFGSGNFKSRAGYILVGIGGCGEGNGAEAYQGAVDNDTNGWCDMGFAIVNSMLTGVSTSYTPRTLTDYSYIGDLDATKGAPSGTNVAGVPADTLVSQAAAGNTASTTINSPPVISTISNVTATNVYKPAVTIATKTPSVSAGVGPFTFDWRAENITVGDVDINYVVSTVTNTNDKNTINAVSQVTGGAPSQDLVTVTVTDSKGRVSITQFTVNASC